VSATRGAAINSGQAAREDVARGCDRARPAQQDSHFIAVRQILLHAREAANHRKSSAKHPQKIGKRSATDYRAGQTAKKLTGRKQSFAIPYIFPGYEFNTAHSN
jgi:hypothetical protein